MEPLTSVLALLRPRTVLSKVVEGAGRWGVRYPATNTAGFGLVLKGRCFLTVDGFEPFAFETGDFLLMPRAPGFQMASGLNVEPYPVGPSVIHDSTLRLRHGAFEREPEFELLGGFFEIDPTNATMLQELLPTVLHIRACDAEGSRFLTLIRFITQEVTMERPGRDLILQRLVEVLLVEALRHPAETALQERPGLLRGLADADLARALQEFHNEVSQDWTLAKLASVAGLSRSTFSERFREIVGRPCMDYVTQWRMALAKDLLLRERPPLEELAERVGYSSASAFSTAFRRQTGQSPRDFVRAHKDVSLHRSEVWQTA